MATRQIPWAHVLVEGVVIVASMSLTGCEPGLEEQLMGAWLITETTVTTPDSVATNSSPQPGLYLFTDRFFSNMLIEGSEPRVPFSVAGGEEERLAAFDVFIADAGTYELRGSTLTTHNIIAKVPDVMTASLRYEYRLHGDSLDLTLEGGWAPTGGQLTYRLVRLR